QQPKLLEDQVGEFFVNREGDLSYFWRWASTIPDFPLNSQALIGRRRTGKTAILSKLFNMLFREQKKVMPVYVTFAAYLDGARTLTTNDFADMYLSKYISCFLAFRHDRPELIRQNLNMDELRPIAAEVDDEILNRLFERYDINIKSHLSQNLVRFAIDTPRTVAWDKEIRTVMIVDEFQVLLKVYDPKQDLMLDLTNGFQWAVDTRWAPMLVSGSSISLLVGNALGGMLSGRFNYNHLKPLDKDNTYKLTFLLGNKNGIQVSNELAETIWQFTGGYPYSIHMVFHSKYLESNKLTDPKSLKKVVFYELGDLDGKLWQHYNEETEKYSDLLNDGTTTRKVMFLSTQYPNQLIYPKPIAEELGLPVDDVKQSLRRLYEADIVQKGSMSLFKGPSDPMLRRFIKYNYKLDILDLSEQEAMADWEAEFNTILGQLNQAKGEIGELYARLIMRGFDGRKVDGRYFNQNQPITLNQFRFIERRGGVVIAGDKVEIDVIGSWFIPETKQSQEGMWLVESKYLKDKVDSGQVEHFIKQSNKFLVKSEETKRYVEIHRWFFSKGGFTKPAIQLLEKEGIYYSGWAQFYALATLLDFRGLPDAP
ncbi:MAG: ATP-binding protein, partial [Chloroflexota bacterium]